MMKEFCALQKTAHPDGGQSFSKDASFVFRCASAYFWWLSLWYFGLLSPGASHYASHTLSAKVFERPSEFLLPESLYPTPSFLMFLALQHLCMSSHCLAT